VERKVRLMDMQEVVALQQTPSYLIHVKQWWVFALLLLRLSNMQDCEYIIGNMNKHNTL